MKLQGITTFITTFFSCVILFSLLLDHDSGTYLHSGWGLHMGWLLAFPNCGVLPLHSSMLAIWWTNTQDRYNTHTSYSSSISVVTQQPEFQSFGSPISIPCPVLKFSPHSHWQCSPALSPPSWFHKDFVWHTSLFNLLKSVILPSFNTFPIFEQGFWVTGVTHQHSLIMQVRK